MINFISHSDLDASEFAVQKSAAKALLPEIKNDEMTGWLKEPISSEEVAKIKNTAEKIRENSDYLVCIGIGGSYLGARAIYEALKYKISNRKTKLLFAGKSMSTIDFKQVIDKIGDKDFSVNVISKSGTTLEPAVAFSVFKDILIKKYGESEANKRIFVTTDAEKGALKTVAINEGYETFDIPDNIGGRFSVLTPVGLLPLAVAGVNIDELLEGRRAAASTNPEAIFDYATTRHILRSENYQIENLASFQPSLRFLTEWWKQLFGESEGKSRGGIFPSATIYSTDLHSLGQYLQDGSRNLFETFISFRNQPDKNFIKLSFEENELFAYLNGRDLSEINKTAEIATIKAHSETRPVFEIEVEDLSEKSLGELIYFFELSCAISAKLQGVNPFDQPGVEAYKKEMYRLLKNS